MENNDYPFINTPLPYSYGALEPYIDKKTMEIHHDRLLQNYVNNLNRTLKENPWLQSYSLQELLYNVNAFPAQQSEEIRKNAGGVFNHRFYFNGMNPKKNTRPEGMMKKKIDNTFGTLDNFKKMFKDAALSVFGSGYAWLVKSGSRLFIITTRNQDTPIELGMCPILAIDVWEHAYFLKHYNERAAYIDNWFQVADWEKAGENLMIS